MVELSPKNLFQSNPDQMKAFGDMAHSPVMQIAVSLALTHFSLSDNPTAEEMAGAKKFIKRLLNLSERDETVSTPTFRSISHSLPKPKDQPPQLQPKT